MTKTWFVTGSAAGFGRVLSETLLARGEQVALTARNPERLDTLVQSAPDRSIALRLDVTDAQQVERAVSAALERFGQIDVLVNNAGYGQMGAVENTPLETARDAMETNYFGPLTLIKAILPDMVARGAGQIVNIGSVANLVGFPLLADYCASKFALAGMTESLGAEVESLGVQVTLAELGPFETNFANAMSIVPPPTHYDPVALSQKAGNARWTTPDSAQEGVAALLAALDAPEPPRRLLLGQQGLEVAELHEERRKAEREKWADVTALRFAR